MLYIYIKPVAEERDDQQRGRPASIKVSQRTKNEDNRIKAKFPWQRPKAAID